MISKEQLYLYTEKRFNWNPIETALFKAAVIKCASRIRAGVTEEWLLNIFYVETARTMSPSKYGPGRRYVGLIQFSQQTIETIATDLPFFQRNLDYFSKMTHIQQLEYVTFFYNSWLNSLGISKFKDIEDLYILSLLPACWNFSYDQPIGTKSGKLTPSQIAKSNPLLVDKKTGFVTKRSIHDFFYGIKDSQASSGISGQRSASNKSSNSTQVQTTPVKKYTPTKGKFIYIHSDTKITTLDGIIKFHNWKNPKDYTKPLSVQDLLKFTDNYGLKNSDRIFQFFENSSTPVTKGKESSAKIVNGLKLFVPYACLDLGKMVGQASTFISEFSKYTGFLSPVLKSLYNSPQYKRQISTQGGSVIKSVPDITVWIYCKALGNYENMVNDDRYQIEGDLINITPFIQELTTNVSKNGGNFSIKLAPIVGSCTQQGWRPDMTGMNITGSEFVAKYSTHTLNGDRLDRNHYWLHELIQNNDLVFIRFEKLELEGDRLDSTFTIPLGEIAGDNKYNYKLYDMIGLVDNNKISYNPANTDVSINITGTDLMKVLTEDGTYMFNTIDKFFNKGLIKNSIPDENRRVRRRYEGISPSDAADLSITYGEGVGSMSSIESPQQDLAEWVTYIFSRLATTEIVPEKVFEGYKDRAVTYSYFNEEGTIGKQTKAPGIWQIMPLIFDESVKNRLIVDNSIATHEGSLISGIQKYCDGRFVEFFGDTYADMYHFTIRKPPYDKASVKEFIELIFNNESNGLQIQEEDVEGDDFVWEDQYFCWYRMRSISFLDGTQKEVIKDKLPIIYFREYNELFGNRSCDVTNNYLPFIPYYRAIGDNTNEVELNHKQIKEDFKYLIESNAYLPFTRKGTITLSGERRIKRGVWIYYKPTREIFYVDAVTQSYQKSSSLNRNTVLYVSRGMRYENESGEKIWERYFDIIDFQENSITSQEQEVEEKSEKETTILFDTDQYSLIEPNRKTLTKDDENEVSKRQEYLQDALNDIDSIANDLLQDLSLKIQINGHTDQDVTNKFPGGNKTLSNKRAESISSLIKNKYVSLGGRIENLNERILISSFADSKRIPLSENQTQRENKILNRRVSITYVKKTKPKSNIGNNSNPVGGSYGWKVNTENFMYFVMRKQMCKKEPMKGSKMISTLPLSEFNIINSGLS